MKYMISGNYRSNPLMRLTLGGAFVLLSFFWVTNALLYFRSMTLWPASVVSYYNGSEDEFAMPRTYGSMLEVTHGHLAMMALVLLLLTHLAIFIPWPLRARITLIVAAFASGLLGEMSSWLVRFVDPGFAVLKVTAFLVLQATMAILLLGLAVYLKRRPEAPFTMARATATETMADDTGSESPVSPSHR